MPITFTCQKCRTLNEKMSFPRCWNCGARYEGQTKPQENKDAKASD